MSTLLAIVIGLIGPALIAYMVWSDPSGSLTRYNKLIDAYLTGKLPNGPDPNPVMGPPRSAQADADILEDRPVRLHGSDAFRLPSGCSRLMRASRCCPSARPSARGAQTALWLAVALVAILVIGVSSSTRRAFRFTPNSNGKMGVSLLLLAYSGSPAAFL